MILKNSFVDGVVLYEELRDQDIAVVYERALVMLLNKFISLQEFKEILEIKNSLKFSQSISARYMIFKYLSEKYPSHKICLTRDSSGLPYLIGILKFVSISHSNKMVVVAIANHNIGIDTEYINKPFPKIISNNWNIEEQQFNPYHIWTAKESYLKLLGCGLQKKISDISVKCLQNDTNIIIDLNHEVKVLSKTIFVNDYVLTITKPKV